MKTKLKYLLKIAEKNSTQIYLIVVNFILVFFGIWFSNAGLLPFKSTSDFFIFFVLGIILAIYRPSWTFAFFIGCLVLENVNLAPKNFGITIRPYQFFGFITWIALLVKMLARQLTFFLPKWKWFDLMPILFVLGGFLSSLDAVNKSTSLKQSIIALSFVALYFLGRIYIQSLSDLKRITPFFLSSSFIVVAYSFWQNIRFLHGANSFEVMPGRPNANFTEPDWLGIYLVFLLAILFSLLYKNRKNKILVVSFRLLITLTLTSIILTVSRSAWLGAIILIIGFWKINLFNGSLKISSLKWKNFLFAIIFSLVALGVSFGISTMLTRFQISNRAQSSGGLQKITISCEKNHSVVPQTINDIAQLSQYSCKHINLEDIQNEKGRGRDVFEIYRTDPTVNIRAQIYQKSFAQIKSHPFFGIGWGSISQILGNDERGAGLNASNIFMEIYLGSGLIGFLSFVLLIAGIFIMSIKKYFSKNDNESFSAILILFGFAAIIIPNLFNSGIFLGFVWIFLAICISLLKTEAQL